MQRRVARLGEQTLLRINRRCFDGREAECAAVEALRTRHEAAVTHALQLRRAQSTYVAHELESPPSRRHLAERVAARVLQLPARRLVVAPTGPTADGSDQSERRRRRRAACACRHRGLLRANHLLEQVCGDGARRRVLEDERRRERHARERAQPRRQLGRSERVDPRLHQRRLSAERRGRRARQLAHDSQHRRLHVLPPLRRRQRAKRLRERAAGGGCGRLGGGVGAAGPRDQLTEARLRGIDKVTQQLLRVRAVRELNAEHKTTIRVQLRAEACRVLLERDRCHASDGDLALGQRGKGIRAHASPAHHWPLQADRWQAVRPPRECVRVEAAIASRVGGLPDVAEAGADR